MSPLILAPLAVLLAIHIYKNENNGKSPTEIINPIKHLFSHESLAAQGFYDF